MASKSAQQEPEQAEVIEETLDELETTIDRLKALYEQYFLGILKQPPQFLHTELERKLRDVAQLQIRNTALRYRFATLQQKFGSYHTYWRRTLREIEAGRYHRSLSRVTRHAAATGAEIPYEILAAMPKRMREQVRRDREAALALQHRRRAAAEPVELLPDDLIYNDDDDDDDAAFVHETLPRPAPTSDGRYPGFIALRSPPRAPPSAPPIAPPSAPASAPSQQTRPNPIAPGSSTTRPPVAVETMAGPFPRRAPTAPPPPPPPSPSASPSRPPPIPPSRTASRPRPEPRPPPPEPRPPPPPGMTEADVNALYATYVKAREMMGQPTGPGSLGKLLKTIHAQAPKIMEQYRARGVEFSVVIKDSQVIIRAKPKM